jgi:Flp pilus assembly protein TadG
MHRRVSPFRRARRRRDEHGAVAIVVALSMVALLVGAAMVIDFGLVRVDRQIDKSAADEATAAGLHGLNAGDGNPHPFIGVCTALRYLEKNNSRFEDISDTVGTWATGTGAGAANGCTDVASRARVCVPGNPASWARFTWTGVLADKPLTVTIESGYVLSSGTGWSEDVLPAAAADEDDEAQGCDQLAVSISQARSPGLGSLATSSDLETAIRSVGRVEPGPGGYAPAMLLLKQTGCPVLDAGSASGDSFIHVLGAISSNNIAQPGSIHADSDALGGCSGGSNQNTYLGTGANGIVAYAAPTVGSPTVPDPSKPGEITSVGAANGMGPNFLYDSLDNVYGSNALSSGGTKAAVKGRALVTRKPVDDRYIVGVRDAISSANSVFSNAPSTYTKFPGPVNACKPTQAEVNALALTAASNLYIDCNGKFVGDGDLVIPAGHILFRGWVNPAGELSMPNAQHVYVANDTDVRHAFSLGTGSAFRMNNMALNLNGSLCSNGQGPGKATLFVKTGDIQQSGTSRLQMCRTTVFMMGGSTTGCVPVSVGTAPTAFPCPGINGGLGTGQFTQTGGDIDWTAPDKYDVMTLLNGDPDPARSPAWSDPDGPEDLALWSESATNNSNTYNMNGGGVFHVRGVYMVPNADPFQISGGADMNLTNAQFVAGSISLSGAGTHITMSVDPNSGITLPTLKVVGLVR